MTSPNVLFPGEQDTPGDGKAVHSDHRVRQLLELNRAAIAITAELELDPLLQRIVDVARELAQCKYVALGVLGDDGYLVRFPTSGISKSEREKIGELPRGHGLLGVMLRAGRSIRIPDISKDPRRSGFPPNHPPMTSLLGVPIFMQGKLVGDLYLTDKIDGPEFSEEDEWLVQLLAVHAATALTNAQLHTENMQALADVKRERARSQALFKVTQAINRSVQFDEVVALIVEAAVDLLNAPGAAIFVLQESESSSESNGSTRLVAHRAIGLENPLTSHPIELPLEGSIAGRAIRTSSVQIVNDTAKEPGIIIPKLMGAEVRSLVVVPLLVKERPIGVLSTYHTEPDSFDEEAVSLLEVFGSVASAAIYNATLYEEAQKGREAAEREQQRLKELEQMKDEFLSTAAHELRTPLTSIRMSAGLAHEQMRMLAEPTDGGTPLDPRLVDLIGLVVESSERMQFLVNDLLDLTRLEQGRTNLNFMDIDLRDVARASVEATAPLFNSKQQKLALRLPEAHCGVKGDPQRLEQVVINLLSNAHKYSPPGSQVEIRTVRSGDECMISVRDNGPGVPAEEREHIFERFYRSSIHRQDRTSSTGLGLPIARTIAELHKGRLRVEAAEGGGSMFTLVLPLSQG